LIVLDATAAICVLLNSPPDRAGALRQRLRDEDIIWALCANVTAYDAACVALAAFLGVPLITQDARLARAGTGTAIEVF
jgi:hypothetical protein